MSKQHHILLTPEELTSLVREAVVEAMAEFVPGDSPTLLTKKQLATKLGCSQRTIDRLRNAGCPAIKLLDSPRFELTSVLSWLNSDGNSKHQTSPTSQLRLVQNPGSNPGQLATRHSKRKEYK